MMEHTIGTNSVQSAQVLCEDILEIPATGPFTVFGITKRPVRFIESDKLDGSHPVTVPFGKEAHLFIRTPAANLVEADESIVLKLGHICSLSGEVLSARDLLVRKVVTPQEIDHHAVEGDALVVCFDRRSPRFSALRMLLGIPDLYYMAADGDILCSDNLSSLIRLLPAPEVDPEMLPLHFLYRLVGGDRTYIRHVHRLASGSILIWHTGMLELKEVKDLRGFQREVRFTRLDEESSTFISHQYGIVIDRYLEEITQSGKRFGTLLSGGVDSTLMQLLINEHLTSEEERRTFSYAVETPVFQPEIAYAVHASQVLGTRHTFVPVTSEMYPALLEDTTRIVGQPVPIESLPCVLSVARYLQEQASDVAYLFSGAAADTLHGGSKAEILWHLQKFLGLPGARLWLKLFEPFMRPVDPHRAFVLRSVIALLPYVDDITSPHFPCNSLGLYTDLELARRCFGEQAIRQAFASWREGEIRYLNSSYLLEKDQAVGLVDIAAPVASLWHQLFLAYGIGLIHPYMDERIVKATHAFDPRIRFYHKGKTKPILKYLLEQRSASEVTTFPKRGSGFHLDLMEWMEQGTLQEMVHAIERPGFISKVDFDRKIEKPDWFTWNLLTFDLFRKSVLQTQSSGS